MFLCFQLKQIEVQLEEEYDDKQKVLRERRELETKLLSAQDQVLSDTSLPVHHLPWTVFTQTSYISSGRQPSYWIVSDYAGC